MRKIFIACPMSGLAPFQYKLLQERIQLLVDESTDIEVFSEILNINDASDFQSSKEATEIDIKEIKRCDTFVLFHMTNVQSSTLFEVGIAFALEKDIQIYYRDEKDLPFMLKELDLVSNVVTLTKISNPEDVIL